MLTPILIHNINTRELENNVNPTSKKLKFSRFLTFMLRQKTLDEWEKNNRS